MNSNSLSTSETKVSSLSLVIEEQDPGIELDKEVRNFSQVKDKDRQVTISTSRAKKKKDNKLYRGLKDSRNQYRVLKNR